MRDSSAECEAVQFVFRYYRKEEHLPSEDSWIWTELETYRNIPEMMQEEAALGCITATQYEKIFGPL